MGGLPAITGGQVMTAAVLTAALIVSPATANHIADPAPHHLSGVQASAYHGKFYRAGQEAYRRCILRRESNGHYYSTNRSGDSWGGYQMTKALGVGAAWMLQPELMRLLGKDRGRKVAEWMRSVTPDRWNRWQQDAAFSTILNWQYDGSGAKHWSGGRWTCTLGGAR